VDVEAALAELTDVSSQVRAAVVLDGDGSVLGSTLGDEERARRLAEGARELLSAAQEGGRERTLTQLEVATLDGSVFVVRDGERTIAATTGPEPTVGLVFYDLKSCLRAAAEPEPRPKRRRRKADDGA
jgi:predicted regulator of Ras-like GTPase activity (Roadblock/LC7/MglB family)